MLKCVGYYVSGLFIIQIVLTQACRSVIAYPNGSLLSRIRSHITLLLEPIRCTQKTICSAISIAVGHMVGCACKAINFPFHYNAPISHITLPAIFIVLAIRVFSEALAQNCFNYYRSIVRQANKRKPPRHFDVTLSHAHKF